MKFASFVVTFNRPLVLKQTIEILLKQTRPPDALLIVDNGNSPETEALVRSFGDERLQYSAPGSNLGSAGGCAYGLEWFYERGFDWIHCGDDDDPPKTADTLERLLAIVEHENDDKLGCVAAFGNLWDWRTGQFKRIEDDQLTGLIDVDAVGGNSQLIVSRDVIRSVGVPEKQFFFGFYDPLYCLRLKRAGYRIMIDGRLTQEYRVKSGRLNFKLRSALLPRDSANSMWRRFYVTRNYIFSMTRTFGRPDLARREAFRAMGRALASWGHGPAYGLAFTKLQLRGVWDGYRGRLGRTIEPNPKTAQELKRVAAPFCPPPLLAGPHTSQGQPK